MNTANRSWGNHYSRYHRDPNETLECLEIHKLRIEHELMEKGWQKLQKYHKVRHVPTACCVQTGLRAGSKTPRTKCNLKKAEEMVNASRAELFGNMLPEVATSVSSMGQIDEDDDDCHYGVRMCMAF